MSNRDRNNKKGEEISKLISEIRSDVENLLSDYDGDLLTAKQVQKKLTPKKFKNPQGFQSSHKYMSGLKSGGNYVDFFEFKDGIHYGLIFADTTGYSLSSALQSALIKLGPDIAESRQISPVVISEKIFYEIRKSMRPQDEFTFFIGVLNRKNLRFAGSGRGAMHLYVQNTDHENVNLKCTNFGTPIKGNEEAEWQKVEFQLNPQDRLLVLSQGFFNCFGTDEQAAESLAAFHGNDMQSLINECVFRIRKGFQEKDDLPEQDCTVFVLDVEKQVLRLASGE